MGVEVLRDAGEIAVVAFRGGRRSLAADFAAEAVRPPVALAKAAAYTVASRFWPDLAGRFAEHEYMRPGIVPTMGGVERYSCPELVLRHEVFDRYGSLTQALYDRGAISVGETQEFLVAMAQSVRFDPEAPGLVRADPDYTQMVEAAYQIGLGRSDENAQERARAEVCSYLQGVVYFRLALDYFGRDSLLLDKFVSADSFGPVSREFLEYHLAGFALNRRDLAAAILSSYALGLFDSPRGDLEKSPTQGLWLGRNPDCSRRIAEFFKESAPGAALANPGSNREKRIRLLAELTGGVGQSRLSTEILGHDFDLEKPELLAAGRRALGRVVAEISAGERQRRILAIVYKYVPLVRINAGLAPAFVGSLLMATAPGEDGPVYTATRWLPESLELGCGYSPLPARAGGEPPDVATVIGWFKECYDGQPDTADDSVWAYRRQAEKLAEKSGGLEDFLARGEGVPARVRELFGIFESPEIFAREFLAGCGPLVDQDINIVNMFHRGRPLSEAILWLRHRWVVDFAEGIVTRLAMADRRLAGARLRGRWQNLDFSAMPEDRIAGAIGKVLAQMDRRIAEMDGEKLSGTKPFKYWQELFELLALRDNEGMKYLVHTKAVGSRRIAMQLGSECPCPARKNLADVSTPAAVHTW